MPASSNRTLRHLVLPTLLLFAGFLTTCDSDGSQPSSVVLDIAVSKTVDNSSPAVGGKIVYEVIARNLGPADATKVTVLDTIPTGLILDSIRSTSGAWNSTKGEWTLPDIPAGTADTIRFFVTVGAEMGGEFRNNQAQRTSTNQTDQTPSNDVAHVGINVAQPDLQVTKTVLNTPITEGDAVQFEIQVKHMGGNSPATGIRVQDALPLGLTFVSVTLSQGAFDSATGIWEVGELLSENDVATMTITATADGETNGSNLTNEVTLLTVDQGDSNPSNNSASASVSVEPVDVSVGKSFTPGAYTDGDIIEFQVVVGLNGGVPVTNLQIAEAIPPGTTFVSATTTNGTYSPAAGIWTIGAKAGGSPADTLYLKVAIDLGTTSVSNTASLFWVDQPDTNSDNDAEDVTLPVHKADAGITKTVSASSITFGGTVIFTITVTNNDPYVPALGVIADDYVSPTQALRILSVVASQGSYSSGTGRWMVGTLPVGASATLRLTMGVREPGLEGPYINIAKLLVPLNGDINGVIKMVSASVTVY